MSKLCSLLALVLVGWLLAVDPWTASAHGSARSARASGPPPRRDLQALHLPSDAPVDGVVGARPLLSASHRGRAP